MRLVHVLTVFLLLVPAFADTHTLDKEKTAAMLASEAKNGVLLPAMSTVHGSVGVTAVMLTQGSVRRLFGSEIAKTYAVVELTISNKSPDAAFVLHSAYIDTSQWALGGGSKGFRFEGLSSDDQATESARAGSRSTSIASVESRIARGQLLDAQQWSARNWTVRLLTLAGSLASGYSFAFKEPGIAKGIAGFNGNFVPGVAMAWPDGAVAQQNRISDFGYQTNKVIGKQSSDIIVCFFPIDMFLSAPFREIFMKSPGLFLSPYQILFGDSNKDAIVRLGFDPGQVEMMRKLHPCYSGKFESPAGKGGRKGNKTEPSGAAVADNSGIANTEERSHKANANSDGTVNMREFSQELIIKNCQTKLSDSNDKIQDALVGLDYIGRFGLQNIGVYVDGIMTVEVDTVPASIDKVNFDGDDSKPEFWAAPGDKKGTIECRFCQGGQLRILEADQLGIKDVTAIADGSDDHHLRFSFTTTRPVSTGQPLTFIITKKSTDSKKSGKDVLSAPFIYTTAYVQIAPSVAKVSSDGKKVTVAGTGFVNTKANPLVISLIAAGQEKPVSVATPDSFNHDKLAFDLPSGLAPGCWSVRIAVGAMEAPGKADENILSAATPELSGATRQASAITVKGKQLVDTSACHGKALRFQLLKTGETKGKDVTFKLVSQTEATLMLPAEAKTGDWSVEILQDGEVKSTVPLK